MLTQLSGDAPASPLAPDKLQEAIADPRPKVRLPGDDYLLSATAADIGTRLFDKGYYLRGGDVVVLRDGNLSVVTPQEFRTAVEKHVICYRLRKQSHGLFSVAVTPKDDEARGILASPHFRERVLKMRRFNRCRLPAIRADGKIELLPEGYDIDTQTLTLCDSVKYPEDMLLETALVVIEDLLGEFHFLDCERSKAVAIAAMLTLYAAQLLPPQTLRPCFIIIGNAEGSGKTLLAACVTVPILGQSVAGSKADDDDEIRKLLLSVVIEGRPVVLLDNVRGKLASEALEAFLSAPTWSDRKLGVSQSATGENLATVIITGNGLTVTPDMRRRVLFVELHLDVERAEDKRFMRPLDVPTLLQLRPNILAALWSLVRNWDSKGRPKPSRGHSAFPTWANVIAGIVEAAGFSCPLDTASIAATADEDGEAMRELVAAMFKEPLPLSFAEVVDLCRKLEIFPGIVGDDSRELTTRERAVFSRLLARYDDRAVGNYRFKIEGKGHSRRYRVILARSQGLQGVSPNTG